MPRSLVFKTELGVAVLADSGRLTGKGFAPEGKEVECTGAFFMHPEVRQMEWELRDLQVSAAFHRVVAYMNAGYSMHLTIHDGEKHIRVLKPRIVDVFEALDDAQKDAILSRINASREGVQ